MSDGTSSGHIQVIVSKDTFTGDFDSLSDVKTGYSLRIDGKFVDSPGSGQDFELQAQNIDVIGKCPSDYILQKHSSKAKGVTTDTLRQIPHLRCRAEWFRSVTRIRHQCLKSTHAFFDELGFVWATTPIITFSDCEGAGEAFTVKTTYPSSELPEG